MVRSVSSVSTAAALPPPSLACDAIANANARSMRVWVLTVRNHACMRVGMAASCISMRLPAVPFEMSGNTATALYWHWIRGCVVSVNINTVERICRACARTVAVKSLSMVYSRPMWMATLLSGNHVRVLWISSKLGNT